LSDQETQACDSRSLSECFERAAERHHFRKALGSGAWQPTYRELNETADRLAQALLCRGGAPTDRVAVLMQHDGPLIAAILAALKAHRVAVVLDSNDPAARLKQQIENAEPAVVLADRTTRELAIEIAGGAARVVCFEDQIRSEAIPDLAARASPDDVAFLVYTSGSSGRPKAVMKTHRQILRNVAINSAAMQYTANDRIPLLGSVAHGQGNTTVWCALLSGAMLCPFALADKGIAGLADWIIDRELTVFVAAIGVFRNFMRLLDENFRFERVRVVFLHSEAVTSDDFKLFQKHFPSECALVLTFSSSETANIAVSRRSQSDKVAEGRLPIGPLSTGQEVLFLDENGGPVQPGEGGEIVVKGHALAAGYWRDPVLTAARFSNAPDGTRLFRTGDRGRINSDGLLEFLGRKDTRVKIRGFRIELSEVEEALHGLPGIDHAVVDAVARPGGDSVLVGYLACHRNHCWSPAGLRRALRATLPDRMLPSAFVLLEQLPLTPNGKIDRQKLRQLHAALGAQASEQRPRTQTEALLADIWAQALQQEQDSIGRRDDFFDLGGDSLIAALVVARVHGAVGVELKLSMFFDHPMLADLATLIDELSRSGPEKDPQQLVRVPRENPLPLSFFQERIWTYSQTRKAAAAYTVARSYRLLGPLDAEVLCECMTYIARRHEILRTTFAVVDGRPVQVVHPAAPVPLPLIDLSDLPEAERQATHFFKQQASRIFDLTRAPLVVFSLVRIRENEHWLLRVSHHIISDGWSWEVYWRELSLLYEARLRDAEPPLPEFEPLQYADYAAWQRKVLAPGERSYEAAIAWWKDRFPRAPRFLPDFVPRRWRLLHLRFQRARPLPDADPASGIIRWSLGWQSSQQVRELARNEGATFYMISLAAFVALLTTEIDQPDVVLGTYVTNRNRVAVQNMIGPFANLATLRLRCDPQRSFREWLDSVRTAVVETEAHCELPYEELRKALHAKGIKLPDIQLIFSAFHRNRRAFADLTLAGSDWRMETMPWGFSVNFDESDEGHDCDVAFDARHYDPAGVHTFVDRFRRLLDAGSRQPALPIGELLAMSGVEAGPKPRWLDSVITGYRKLRRRRERAC